MQSIPYDPALVLGNIVDPKTLAAVLAISAAAAPSDAAEDQLNSLILSKRSLDMTIQELTGMGVNPEAVIKAGEELDKDIVAAAVLRATTMIKSQADIVKAKQHRASVPVSASVESPLDYNKSALKPMPISADTFKMDAQFFTNDQNVQGSSTTMSAVQAYVSASTSFLGDKYSASATASVQSQMQSQYQRHSIAGTLVITAGATHKQAQLFAPLIIDPDKAVRVWNAMYPDDMIQPSNPVALAKIAMEANTKEDDKGLRLLSGATYGSSFVGMVHILNTSTTSSSESMIATAASMQATMEAGCWFASFEGGLGVSSSFSNDVKRVMSMQQIQSHCSLVTMGVMPSIKSNALATGVKVFATDAGAMDGINALSAATKTDHDTMASAADAAITGGQFASLKASNVKSCLSALSDSDKSANQVLDTVSLMTAFEDYVNKCIGAGTDTFGVPINYYLKAITKSQIAQLWVAKYYPQYLAIGENDQVAAQEKKTS